MLVYFPYSHKYRLFKLISILEIARSVWPSALLYCPQELYSLFEEMGQRFGLARAWLASIIELYAAMDGDRLTAYLIGDNFVNSIHFARKFI